MITEEDFMREIAANPHDWEPRLIHADDGVQRIVRGGICIVRGIAAGLRAAVSPPPAGTIRIIAGSA